MVQRQRLRLSRAQQVCSGYFGQGKYMKKDGAFHMLKPVYESSGSHFRSILKKPEPVCHCVSCE